MQEPALVGGSLMVSELESLTCPLSNAAARAQRFFYRLLQDPSVQGEMSITFFLLNIFRKLVIL